MRLVLGTNVALSALLWRGVPHQLLSVIRDRAETIHLFSSQVMLAELAEVLVRPHLAKPLAAIGCSPVQVATDYAAAVDVVAPTFIPQVVRDPDDDQVLACALAARADVIVSGDDDLLSLKTYEGIAVLTPRQALEWIDAAN